MCRRANCWNAQAQSSSVRPRRHATVSEHGQQTRWSLHMPLESGLERVKNTTVHGGHSHDKQRANVFWFLNGLTLAAAAELNWQFAAERICLATALVNTNPLPEHWKNNCIWCINVNVTRKKNYYCMYTLPDQDASFPTSPDMPSRRRDHRVALYRSPACKWGQTAVSGKYGYSLCLPQVWNNKTTA